MSKPNLLFIFTDEQRADTMAAYGNKKIKTPNLDALAAQSVAFEKCYVSQPVCTPSRSTLLTGQWPHTNGCVQNNIPLRPDTACLPEMLAGHADYRTGYFGKWHLGDEIFAQHGFEHWASIEDNYISHYSPTRDRNARSTYHQWLLEKGYKPDNTKEPGPGIFSRNYATSLPEEHCKPAYLAESFSLWLETVRCDEPFVAFINFLEPHMPFTGPRDNQYPLDFVDLPGNYGHIPNERNHLKTRMLSASYRNQGFGGVSLDKEEGWRRILANYWGLVSQVDAAVGAIMHALAAKGCDDETIVVFTSDHGDMMGSHMLLAKTVMFEESTSVPLLLRAPGLKPRKESCPVSHIDVLPTLLDLMGAPCPEAVEGQSLKPLLESGAPSEPANVFIEWSGSNSGISNLEKEKADIPEFMAQLASREELDKALRDPVRTVITPEGWKLNHSPLLGQHELYNLKNDPLELNNLFGVPEHAKRVADLRRLLAQWGEKTKDTVAASI